MLRRFCILLLFVSLTMTASAQLSYGTTGLLHVPTAEMQPDKTLMIGGNFINKERTPAPDRWWYHTWNYFLNVTFFPWLEVAYTCTLIKAEALGLAPFGYTGFTNQDRFFSFRIRPIYEGQFWKHMPAIVLGTSDPFTSATDEIAAKDGNGYFSRFYVAATKHVHIAGKEEIAVHLSYLYNRRKDYKFNGVAGGVSYNPSFHPQLRVIAEYDTKDFAFGATYLLFKHIHFQAELQKMKYFSGGVTLQFRLK